MYAIIDIGGKQYKAKTGDLLTVERLCGNIGDKVDLKVIFKSEQGDKPAESKAAVVSTAESVATAQIVAHGKAKKIVVFKYKPKKNIRKKQGHRQQFTQIKVLSI